MKLKNYILNLLTNNFHFLIAIFLWFVSLTYGSGIGMSLGIYDKTRLLIIGMFVMYLFVRYNKFKITKFQFIMIMSLLLFNIYTIFVFDNSMFDFLWVLLLLPIMSFVTMKDETIKRIGLFYFLFGFLVLIAANFTSVFDGWDGNTVSIISFFSYCLFAASRSDINKAKSVIVLLMFSSLYMFLLYNLNSRSSIIFSTFLILTVINVIPLRYILNKFTIILILILPLIISLIVVLTKDTYVVSKLNEISIETFNKSIYNGRDEIWQYGFETLMKNPLLGIGNLSYSNWHNSAIALLVGGGITGYITYIFSIYHILKKSLKFIDNKIVFGLVVAFITIWLQQTVELGLIGARVNMLPYVLLSILYAKVHALSKMRL